MSGQTTKDGGYEFTCTRAELAGFTARPVLVRVTSCPKCGGSPSAFKDYIPKYQRWWNWPMHCTKGCPRGEHLHADCFTCGYEWAELVRGDAS